MNKRPAQGRGAGVAIAAGLVAVALLATIVLYQHTVDYGFNYDDYVLVRPHSLSEVANSFHGSWDTTGVMVPFYRPVTVAFHALRFELLGLDAERHHLLSLGMFALCAALAGWFVYKMTGRAMPALLASVMFVAHPAMPYSLVAWVTNQMHLIETLTVLIGFCWWSAVRSRSAVRWLPLLGLACIAFMIKEDGIMLLPSIIAMHAMYRRIAEPSLPPVPRAIVAAAVALVLVLIGIRVLALGELGGYGRPSPHQAWTNYIGGLHKVLRLIPADRPWQPIASAFATFLPIVAVLLWRRSRPASRACLLGGMLVALLFNLPFALVTKAEQMHLVATGAVLILSGAAAMLLDAARVRSLRLMLGAVLVTGVLACGAVARDITTDFEPFGPVVLANDQLVRGWNAVPAQLHEYLERKASLGPGGISTNPIDEISHAIFGGHGLETSGDGVRYQWMARKAVEIFIFRPVRAVTIPMRHEIGAFRERTTASIELSGRRIDEIRFDSGEWRESSIMIGASRPPHRIVVSIDHVWYPARIIPGSNDPRALGLQIGEIRLRP